MPTQPDDYQGNEDYVELLAHSDLASEFFGPGLFNDRVGLFSSYGVVDVVPEATTLSLLGTALAALIRRQGRFSTREARNGAAEE